MSLEACRQVQFRRLVRKKKEVRENSDLRAFDANGAGGPTQTKPLMNSLPHLSRERASQRVAGISRDNSSVSPIADAPYIRNERGSCCPVVA